MSPGSSPSAGPATASLLASLEHLLEGGQLAAEDLTELLVVGLDQVRLGGQAVGQHPFRQKSGLQHAVHRRQQLPWDWVSMQPPLSMELDFTNENLTFTAMYFDSMVP